MVADGVERVQTQSERFAQKRRFPDERAGVAYLTATRWPDGFVCPACGHGKRWDLATKATYECTRCRRQISVTAGTVMHVSKLELTPLVLGAGLMIQPAGGGLRVGMTDGQTAHFGFVEGG